MLAWISLAALMTAVTLSMFTKVNVGIVSLAFAWLVGVYLGGLPLNTVIGAFPISLFLTLVGVTLLFGMAHVNGTLERLAAHAVRLCYGNAGLIPLMFFFVALGLSTIGPGNIATAALLAPMAMAIGHQAGVPPFLMILMVGNGAQAGALSPFAPTGVIVNGVMARIGLPDVEWQTYANNMLAPGDHDDRVRRVWRLAALHQEDRRHRRAADRRHRAVSLAALVDSGRPRGAGHRGGGVRHAGGDGRPDRRHAPVPGPRRR
jgi:di/tricarboxylate transporter